MATNKVSRSTKAHPVRSAAAPPRTEFGLRKALFEIAIVAIGVLLALGVDELRDSRSNEALAEQSRAALRTEIEQNRIRLATKLSLLHNAYVQLEKDPGAGPALVDQGANFQITLTDAAWTMAVQTGALRLLDEQERQRLAYIYSSHEIYNRLLVEEMNHWTALAATRGDDSAVKLWEAYARRVAVGGCISTIRIERFRNPALEAEPLRRACQNYRLRVPPQLLYRHLGLPMPDTNWRPGGEF